MSTVLPDDKPKTEILCNKHHVHVWKKTIRQIVRGQDGIQQELYDLWQRKNEEPSVQP